MLYYNFKALQNELYSNLSLFTENKICGAVIPRIDIILLFASSSYWQLTVGLKRVKTPAGFSLCTHTCRLQCGIGSGVPPISKR